MNSTTNLTLRQAQRQAFRVLQKGLRKGGKDIIKPVPAAKISMPATLVQELAFAVTTNNYTFKFGSDRPDPSATLGNVNLAENDVFSCYGIQILLGEGANHVSRVYRSHGNTPSDDCLYAGELTMKQESDEPVHSMSTRIFRQEGDFDPMSGFAFINPQRIVTGRLGRFNVNIQLGAISGLTITSNLFISVILHGAIARG